MKFKSALLVTLNEYPKIYDLSIDSPLSYGQVLVKVLKAGLCGSQIQEIKGYKGNGKFLPHPMGHEGIGQVVDVGEGVTKVKVGDTCVMHWRTGHGIESDFPKYTFEGKTITGGKVTTFSEYSIVSENRLTPLPNSFNNDIGVLLGCSLSTAFGIAKYEINRSAKKILIVGCGGVGLNIIQAIKTEFNFCKVDGLDKLESKLKLFRLCRGDTFYTNLDSLSSEKYDAIVDTTGSEFLFDKLLDRLESKGQLIMVGQPKPDTVYTINNPLKLFSKEGCSIKTTQGGSIHPGKDFPHIYNVIPKSEVDYTNSITHRYCFNDLELTSAFETLISSNCGRILLDIWTDYK